MNSPAGLNSLVIISGVSGSGKHTVFQALEDLGYFCVDNLPPQLILQLVQVSGVPGGSITRLACVVDVRLRKAFDDFEQLDLQLREAPFRYTVVFVDASDDVLVRRYSETRRLHPLGEQGTLLECIRQERERLTGIRSLANLVVDTSNFSVHDLKKFVYEQFEEAGEDRLKVSIVSFGFKYGLPSNADLVFDVRFLPNPYFEPELRPLSGLDPEIIQFLRDSPETRELVDKIEDILVFLLPRYNREGKRYLTVAVGCTGGRHRSVFLAGDLENHLREKGFSCQVVHRDLQKGTEPQLD